MATLIIRLSLGQCNLASAPGHGAETRALQYATLDNIAMCYVAIIR